MDFTGRFGILIGVLHARKNTLPSLGVGRLKLRGDDRCVYGTDKDHPLRPPEDPFYKQMAAEFSKFQIRVDVYAFGDKYTDIASLGLRFTSYHGNFMLRSTDLLALPAVDCDKALNTLHPVEKGVLEYIRQQHRWLQIWERRTPRLLQQLKKLSHKLEDARNSLQLRIV
ncbi:Sec23/Sec24 protein transport family protein [Prunus dulcis]|uniref:Sec23/Sec24 protein transport family protein n=1 Tax=Prunus dulcis TaxID=3755 RepID=A0A4Y1RSX0_PRUDU|nr:Sec23/Sec24 protein transport family protein [Prunus dulcis]